MPEIESFLTEYILDVILGIHTYTYPKLDIEEVKVYIPRPQGFQVYEIVNGLDLGFIDLEKIVSTEECRGDSYLYVVEKVGFNSNEVCRLLKEVLKCSACEVLGLKDVNAVVRQVVVLRNCAGANRVVNLKNRDRYIRAILWQCNPATVMHNGNRIYVEIAIEDVDVVRKRLELIGRYGYIFLNFFGYQRFGTRKPITHLLGKMLVKNEWNIFVKLLCDTEEKRWVANPEDSVCRERFRYEDELKVIKLIPRKLIELYLNAYQSYLFNKTLSLLWLKILNEHRFEEAFRLMLKEYMFVPIIGSKLNIHRPELRVLIDDILTVEEVSIKDFRINELGLEVKGDHRQSMARAFDVKFVIDENMLKFFFTLSRGSYATVFLRELLRVNPLLYT